MGSEMCIRDRFQDKRLQKTLSEGTGKSKSVGYRFQKIEEVIRKTLG